MEIRQAHKEARIARQAAEDADKSRITELGKDMRARMDQLEALMVAKTEELNKFMKERGDQQDRELALLRDQPRSGMPFLKSFSTSTRRFRTCFPPLKAK